MANSPTIGLAERRLIKEFQEGYYATWLKEFHTLLGFELPVTVNWESLFTGSEAMYGHYEPLVRHWKNNYFESLTETFKGLTSDAMGKEAVKAKVKKITIEGADTSSLSRSLFSQGSFDVRFSPTNGSNSPEAFANDWIPRLEAGL